MKLTGAAILVSRGIKVLQAAPAAYPYRSDLGFLAIARCWRHAGIGGSAALVRPRSPGEPIAEWGWSAWEVAHGSIHAFAVHPVAVVGDGRILPFLPGPFDRLLHYGGVQGFF